jgi:hypothetical protein
MSAATMPGHGEARRSSVVKVKVRFPRTKSARTSGAPAFPIPRRRLTSVLAGIDAEPLGRDFEEALMRSAPKRG